MVRTLTLALALIVTLVATGCSGGTSGGAMPPVSPALTQSGQPIAQTRQSTDTIGGIDGGFMGFAARVFKPLQPIVSPTPAPTVATPVPCDPTTC